ncbi:MAG: putative toxin-antitoxin system toxin component, PIN family [Muribaculaceae bacterium]|nr:putative toxin-antitoxin system toxin component, PIN family [Muribaculaceae bacterium]
MKVILDTNIWISFLLGKRLSLLIEIFNRNDIKIFVSRHLIGEIEDVVSRSKISKYVSFEALTYLKELISVRCEMVSSEVDLKVSLRDVKDLFILGMAKNANADYIVTGDKDLLVLEYFEDTKIITFIEFKGKFLE